MTNGQFRKYYSHVEENWTRHLRLYGLKMRVRQDKRRALCISDEGATLVIEESPNSEDAVAFVEQDGQPRRVLDSVVEAIYTLEEITGSSFSEELGLEILLEK